VKKWVPWMLLSAVVIAALVIGTRPEGTRTEEERIQAIAETIACPACNGQSVASSDAPASQNIRTEIARRVEAGESPDEIRAAFAQRFGDDILLNPPRSGAAAAVWVIPVVAIVAAGTGLAFAFRRWRREW
jgi:cytochrome c-type biogenesis protein CcmH/NrfF